ncbi:MAG TPA: hypothetical protein VFD38_07150 [Myxococcaceae bacterium]|nr:hypothetical protein [Myxococcaceae bacterium]
MSTLVVVDGVLWDLEASGPFGGVSPLVGEPSPDDERTEEPERSSPAPADDPAP